MTIKLPYPSSNPRHPLPLGILISTSAEPALLVVMPTSGKITYWDSLSSAETLDTTRRKQQSIQGVVPGLMSGESVTSITEAEPRGCVLAMSTGRLAHLIVSDPQGRPSINIEFLRDTGASSGGVFGSLRSVFSGAGWKKDVAAVRAGGSYQRGQRYVIVATKTGTFQTWDLNWNGSHALVGDLDARSEILKALSDATGALHNHKENIFEILDIAMTPKTNSANANVQAKQNSDCKVMALTVYRESNSTRYAVVMLTLAEGSLAVDVVHPITCYQSSIPAESKYRPKLIVSDPAQMAFVVFETVLVFVSLAKVEETPSSQLQMEAHTLPDPFQDAIGFREDKPYKVVGCVAEPCDPSHAQSSCLVMVYGFGIIRVATLPFKEEQSTLQSNTVRARTKIEQAVHFGSLPQDLLDFSPRPEVRFSPTEIETAALQVSQSIMDSTSPYIPAIGPSMEHQLQRRSTVLAELNQYLREYYRQEVKRVTKWKLLWHAEKMASAKAIWRCYSLAIANPPKGIDDRNFLAETIEDIHQSLKNENQPEHHETDGVRHWFIHDLWRLEHIIPYAQIMAELLFKESVQDHQKFDRATQGRFASEANDVQLAALETAFKFRADNAASYGLENEVMIDGVLQNHFDELPEFWTSTHLVVQKVKSQTDYSHELASYEDPEEKPPEDWEIKLARDNPRQVQLCCQTWIERFRWLKSRQDKQDQKDGEELMKAHFAVRKDQFAKLSIVGLPQEGIKLAEKYHDMEALVTIIGQELEAAESVEDVQIFQERIFSYFTVFGTKWAKAYFQQYLEGGKAVVTLTNNIRYKTYLTKFLRTHHSYAKLGWINEVISERDYSASSRTLQRAEMQEGNLWSRKMTASMNKLSLLAATSQGQIQETSAKPTMLQIDENMALYMIQEKLYQYMKPSLREALDADAEIDLAMQRYGSDFVKDKPFLKKTLEQNLQKLLAMENLTPKGMVDVLTLIDNERIYEDDEEVVDLRFFSALKVLRSSKMEKSDPGLKALLERIIWRRCMIQDDWDKINRTELKSDTQVEVETAATSLFKTLKKGFSTDFLLQEAPLPPSSVSEAGTTIDSLKTSAYFSNTPDNTLALLAQDLTAEAELLDRYVETGRLEEWWKGVVDAAKAVVRTEADEEGEMKLKKRNAKEEFNRRLAEMDKETSGNTEGFIEVDAQGDIIMA